MNNKTIIAERTGAVARIWLNRPESRNALNRDMAEELVSALQRFNSEPGIRVIVIRGRGTSFCSGADLRWMGLGYDIADADNLAESTLLATCYRELFESPRVTVAAVHGPVYGGAIGLIAACDLAIASDGCTFAFSEVNLGLIPSVISPYVFSKAEKGKVLEYMLTGRKFSGTDAVALGLVNRCVPEQELEQSVEGLFTELLRAAPGAQSKIKSLFRSLSGFKPDPDMLHYTASILAETLVSGEAREGIRAFFEKRQPGWLNP